MHQIYKETLEKLKSWARQESTIHAVIVLGSQVRADFSGDEWSDLDILLMVDDPQAYLKTDAWLACFGDVVCLTIEEIHLDWLQLNWIVKRVLFTDNRTVDFSIMSYDRLDDVLSLNAEIHANGYQIIYDDHPGFIKSKVDDSLMALPEKLPKIPSADELYRLVRTLLFYLIFACKKIRRNELWVAVACINQQVSNLLLKLIEYHVASVSRVSQSICYEGRFLEQRLDPTIQAELIGCFTKYDADDVVRTVDHLIGITSHLTEEICEANNYNFADRLFERIRSLYHEIIDNDNVQNTEPILEK